MPRRPKVWFDYEYLTSLDAESAPREVFFLSEPAQQVLSQLAEIVLWPTRWFNGDPDDSATMAASIYEELKVPAHFDDLIPLLDDVETLLQELIDKEACCDTIDSVPGGDEINGVDETTLPPDVDRDGESLPPEYEGDPEAYDAYLCGQAKQLSDTTDDAVDAAYKAILAASNILVFATLVVLMFGNVIGMGIAAIVAGGYTLVTISEVIGYYSAFTELRELLGGGDPQGLVPQTKSELAGAASEIENAVFCANDAGEAYDAIAQIIDANVSSGAYAALLKLTYSLSLRAIFWGFGGADDDNNCDCVEPALFVWDWSSGLDGWVTANPNVSLVYNGSAVEVTPNTQISERETNNPETGAQIASRFSLVPDIQVERIEFDISFTAGSGAQIHQTVRIGLWGQDDGVRWTDYADSDVIGYGNQVTVDTTLATPALLRGGLITAKIAANRDAPAADGQRGLVTAIRCYGSEGN